MRADSSGAELRVRVQPGAARPAIAGIHGEALRVRVRARPVEGAANRELVVTLAELLGVRAAAVSIASGAHGREKRVRIHGLAAADVRERVEARLRVDSKKGGG